MAINLDAIRGRLNKLQSTTSKKVELWKPTPGKHQIRLVPYKFNKDNPFIELYFHYNINNKSYLSPQSFLNSANCALFKYLTFSLGLKVVKSINCEYMGFLISANCFS